MRRALIFALGLFPFPALADDCISRLAAQITSPKILAQPYEVVQDIDLGGQKLVVLQKFLSDRHYLSITLDPAGVADTLYHEGGTFTADGAGGWTLAYAVDADQAERESKEARAAQAANIVSATCDQSTLDGAKVDQITARIKQPPGFDSDIDSVYLIDPASDLWLRVQTTYSIGGAKTVSSSVFTLSPGLTLPTPSR